MLVRSLKRTSNLMSSRHYSPRAMLFWAAEQEPDTVQQMFRVLYDEKQDLKSRMRAFGSAIDGIVQRHPNSNYTDVRQDDRALMVYLSMRYPEKYYLYKYGMFDGFNRNVCFLEKLSPAGSYEIVQEFTELCELVRECILQDSDLLAKYEPERKKLDPEYHLLVQDIIYSQRYYLNPIELEEESNKPAALKLLTGKAIQKEVELKAVHVDYEKEAAEQKKVGDAGERFVLQKERKLVASYHLSPEKQVVHVSVVEGDGLGYDILSYDKHGNELYIEVKATQGTLHSTFYITANELKKSKECPEQYRLYRVFNLDIENETGEYRVHEGSLEEYCVSPVRYRVDLK